VLPKTKLFPTILLVSILLMGCAPLPPSWPPFPDALTETASWYIDAERFRRSAHGSLSCDECHSDIVSGDASAPHPDVARLPMTATELYDYETCNSCHPQEYAAYQQGVHAEAMANLPGTELDELAPTCGHCHDAHYASAETRLELLTHVGETCGSCHERALETYFDDYHGKAALLGLEQTATCADCHGAHTVLALYETHETIAACRRCHPATNAGFVSYRIHAQETLNPQPDDADASDARILFWVKLFFTCLVIGVLAFFYAHTGLWFLRSLHERLRGKRHG
jgi:hypothetical protein